MIDDRKRKEQESAEAISGLKIPKFYLGIQNTEILKFSTVYRTGGGVKKL